MAYKNLVAESINSRQEIFQRIRDWVCQRNGTYDYSTSGLGWTLHDSSYASSEDSLTTDDYVIFYSEGEDGDQDLYYRMTYTAATTTITFQLYHSWDNSTHTGVSASPAYAGFTSGNESGDLYIYGSLDFVFLISLYSASKYGYYFGKVTNSIYDDTVATSSSAVSIGSSVPITVDAVPSAWAVGGKIALRDDDNIEHVVITDITSLVVTVQGVTSNYAAGCKLSEEHAYILQTTNNINSTAVSSFNHLSTKNVNTNIFPLTYPGYYANPDDLNEDYIGGPVMVGTSGSAFYGTLENIHTAYTTGFTHLEVYTTAGGDNYRAFVSLYSSVPLLLLEV